MDADHRALLDFGFNSPKFFSRSHWAAIIQIGSFSFLVDGNRAAISYGYQNRWEYNSPSNARAALLKWDGKGEPQGFIGKRLSNGITTFP